jgi:NAD(P)-dependent dehydrogenase (short-subunit alcohol dehydrogenase family)
MEPNPLDVAMAHEFLQNLDASNTGRVHIVVVSRTASTLQTPWHEIEQTLGQEIQAIIASAHDQLFQAIRAASPVVIAQPNAVISSQIIKLAENLNARVQTPAGGS